MLASTRKFGGALALSRKFEVALALSREFGAGCAVKWGTGGKVANKLLKVEKTTCRFPLRRLGMMVKGVQLVIELQ